MVASSTIKTIAGITFASWHACWYLPFWIILLFLIWWTFYKRQLVAARLAHHQHRRTIMPGYSVRKIFIKALLQTIAVMGLFIASLQPQWGTKEQQVTHVGRDLFIALDISPSMLAQDVSPDRLAAAKQKIKKIVRSLHADRVGLIAFSSVAFIHCPLTADYTAFELFLDAIDAQTIAHGSTALDGALKTAMTAFSHIKDDAEKLLVIVTDGEDFSQSLQSIAQQARDQHIVIGTLGIGSQYGAPVPQFDIDGRATGHIMQDGKVVISKLNESLLQELAKTLNGLYVHSTDNDQDVHAIVSWISKHSMRQLDETNVSLLHDRYPYALAGTLICLILEWL